LDMKKPARSHSGLVIALSVLVAFGRSEAEADAA
jgi:hypothetical protein